jgi:hypothetical protein
MQPEKCDSAFDPDDSPTEHAQDGDQVYEPLCRTELHIFYFATGLQDLVKGHMAED